MLTPEQDEANMALAAAIQRHAEVFDLADGLLNDFIVVAAWTPIEGEGSSPYSVHFPREFVPHHIAIGLLQCGEQYLSGGEEG